MADVVRNALARATCFLRSEAAWQHFKAHNDPPGLERWYGAFAMCAGIWPRILTWTDEQVAEVERWLVDSSADMDG